MATKNLGRVVGENGRGIDRIEKTGTQGLTDIYTIYYSDGTTSLYEVKNGENGKTGDGTGDMLVSIYDPTGRNCDVFGYIDEKTEEIGDVKYGDTVYYHIKESGNDDNDGLTAETAFKTLDRFLGILNSGRNDIRCYIEEAGTYEVTKTKISGATVYIEAKVPGVIVSFGNTEKETEILHSSVTFKGVDANNRLTLQHANGVVRCVKSYLLMQYCESNAEYNCTATTACVISSTISNIVGIMNSDLQINETQFTATETYCIYIHQGSQCTLTGTLSTMVIPDSTVPYLYSGSGCVANVLQTWTSANSTTRPSYELHYTVVHCTSAVKNAWEAKKKSSTATGFVVLA